MLMKGLYKSVPVVLSDTDLEGDSEKKYPVNKVEQALQTMKIVGSLPSILELREKHNTIRRT
jgi:hypothetical protein